MLVYTGIYCFLYNYMLSYDAWVGIILQIFDQYNSFSFVMFITLMALNASNFLGNCGQAQSYITFYKVYNFKLFLILKGCSWSFFMGFLMTMYDTG